MQATLPHSYLRRCCTISSLSLVLAISVLLSVSRPLAAADGRDFAGSYHLSDIVEQDDTVSATFRSRVFNYSDAEVADAAVVLDSRLVLSQTYCSFSSISIINRGSVRLRCAITIPKAEYNAWEHGARPNLHLDTSNADGTSLRRIVELTRNLLGEEQNEAQHKMRTAISSVAPEQNLAVLASAQQTTITTYAGGGPVAGPALSINVPLPQGVAAGPNGDVYFTANSATANGAVYKLSGGIAVLIAGTPGIAGFSGDGGPATSASLSGPNGIAVDGSGNVYIADSGRIRKVSADTGLITTVAGNGSSGFSGDGGPATNASLGSPSGVAVDGSGNIYIADTPNGRIRKVSADTGVITTVACSLNFPIGVAVDGSGDLYIADTYNARIRKVSATTGVITTVAGNGGSGFSGDGGPATTASLYEPSSVTVDRSGNVYIVDSNRIRKVSANTGLITTVAGNGSSGFSGDGGPAASASLDFPYGMAVGGSGNLYIADYHNQRIREVFATTGIIITVAGNSSVGFSGDGGTATDASLAYPSGVAVDSGGNLYIADSVNRRVRKVDHRISTTTLLTSKANPTTTQNLFLTAAITPDDATGTVTFFDGNTMLRSVPFSGGTATLSDLLLTGGTHALVAYYSGGTNYAMSTSPALLQVVSRASCTMTLTSEGQPTQSDSQTVYVSMLNSPATFTATLSPATAGGTVQFFDGPTSLGVQTISGGTALFTTSSLTLGNHTISAVYNGDAFFFPSWAAPVIQQVQVQ
ncbi:MAG: Ig-like domain repeat protein [Bryobacteraceae bacterium]